VKTIERRLEKLEAAAGVGVEELSFEIWLIEPGTMRAELHHSFVMGCPDTYRRYAPGERIGVSVPRADGKGWEIVESAA